MYIVNTAMPRSLVFARWLRHLLTTPEQTSPAVLSTAKMSRTIYPSESSWEVHKIFQDCCPCPDGPADMDISAAPQLGDG